MSLRNFDYFLKIAEQRNITKAAEQLFISQPSLSKYLRLLEEEAGAPLFYRTTPLQLTKAGEAYYAMAKSILEEEDRFREAISRHFTGVREKLRVGIPVWRNSLLASSFSLAFAQNHPEIDVESKELFGFEADYESSVISGVTDCCLCNSDTRQEKLFYYTLCMENLLLMGSNEHPVIRDYIAQHEPDRNGIYHGLSLSQLDGEHFVCCESAQAQGRAVFSGLKKSHIRIGKLTRTTAIPTVVTFAANNQGFSFFPELGYTLTGVPHGVSCFLMEKPSFSLPFCLVSTESAKHNAALYSYIKELSQFCESHLLRNMASESGAAEEPSAAKNTKPKTKR